MTEKRSILVELAVIYGIILVITFLTPTILRLGESIPVKMLLMVLPFVMIAAAPILMLILRKAPLAKTLGFKRALLSKQFVNGLGIFLVTGFIFVIAPLLLGFNKHDVLSFKVSSPSIFMFYIVYYMIFVGFSEEIVFRGYFYEKLKAVTNSGGWAVIISAVIFGLWHYPLGQNLLQVLMTTLIGLIYGYSRLKLKNSTTLSVGLAHGLHDTLILVLSSLLL